MKHFDGIYIGGGPGGYEGALYSARLGKKVAIIEKYKLGGVCLHWGCIPTKTLISTSKLLLSTSRFESNGLPQYETPSSVDWAKVSSRREKVIQNNLIGLEKHLEVKGINRFTGIGSFLDNKTVRIQSDDSSITDISGDKIFIATGSYPVPVPGTNWEDDWMIPGEQCLFWNDLPKSILIVGAGVMGCEFASIFSPVGVDVHVVEIMENVLPTEDIEISKTVKRELKKMKVNLHLGKKLTGYQKVSDGVLCSIEGKGEITVDKVLICAGRKALVNDLNLENAGVELDDYGNIKTNDSLQTSIDSIYGIGDVIGPPLLAHGAYYDSRISAYHAFTGNGVKDYSNIPAGIFTIPEIGRVGLTEQECQEKGIEYRVGTAHLRAIGRAHTEDETTGFCKIIVDKENKIIGCHIMGVESSEMIHTPALAMSMEMTTNDLENKLIFVHPTFSEVIWEALKDVNS